MNVNQKTWTSAVYACVEENYGLVLQRWQDTSKLEPGSWEELLCWAGQLRWNAMVSGLPATLSRSFPNNPGYSTIITRLRSEGMYTLANSLDAVLKLLPVYPESLDEIDPNLLESLHFPMREGWEHGFVLNSVLVDQIPPHQTELYNAYRGLSGTGAIFEIYRFLDDLQDFDDSIDINTDLLRFRLSFGANSDLDAGLDDGLEENADLDDDLELDWDAMND